MTSSRAAPSPVSLEIRRASEPIGRSSAGITEPSGSTLPEEDYHHDTDRATGNWRHVGAKARSIGHFSRHVKDKSRQREDLGRFIKEMRLSLLNDEEDLVFIREHTLDRIRTMRPKTAVNPFKPPPNPEGPTYTKYEVKPGTTCTLCNGVFKAGGEYAGYPCRICDLAFHRNCLLQSGRLHTSDIITMAMATTNIGWSCYNCANLCLLLTEDEVKEMTFEFEKCDINSDCSIVLPEYIRYRTFTEKGSAEDLQHLEEEFHLMDLDGDGRLDWWEFANFSAKRFLAKKNKRDLVDVLTEKELLAAKATFIVLDVDGDGRVKEYEAIQAYKSWYRHFEHSRCNDTFARESAALEFQANQAAKFVMEADSTNHGDVRWDDFILDQALYIISSRPNMAVQKASEEVTSTDHPVTSTETFTPAEWKKQQAQRSRFQGSRLHAT